jgi:hypothetical protein
MDTECVRPSTALAQQGIRCIRAGTFQCGHLITRVASGRISRDERILGIATLSAGLLQISAIDKLHAHLVVFVCSMGLGLTEERRGWRVLFLDNAKPKTEICLLINDAEKG